MSRRIATSAVKGLGSGGGGKPQPVPLKRVVAPLIVKVADGYTISQAATALNTRSGWSTRLQGVGVRMLYAEYSPDTLTLAELRTHRDEIAREPWAAWVSLSGFAPALEAAVEVSPAPEPTATPTAGLQRVEFFAPGTYAGAPGLDYEFEIAWVDRSLEWDWVLKNQDGGCYDALRAFMGPLPAQHGVRKYEIALTDTGETLI